MNSSLRGVLTHIKLYNSILESRSAFCGGLVDGPTVEVYGSIGSAKVVHSRVNSILSLKFSPINVFADGL